MTWKKIGLIILGLIVLLIVALFVVVSSYDFNKLKPQIASAVQEATGRELTLGGDIELDFGLSPSLVVRDVSLQNADWGSKPNMAELKRFELQVALLPLITGEVQVKRLILIEPTLLVERNAKGRFNFEFAPAKPAAAKKPAEKPAEPAAGLPQLSFKEVRLEGAMLDYRDEQTKQRFEARVDGLTASADSPSSPVQLELEATFDGQPISASGSVGSMESLLASGESWPLDLTAKAAGLACDIKGRVNTPLAPKSVDLSLNVQGKSLDGLEQLAKAELPLQGPLQVRLGLQSKTMKQFMLSELSVQAGESALTGSGVLDAGRAVPHISAKLHSPKLDLSGLAAGGAKKEPGAKKPAQAEADRIFPDTPIPTDVLRSLGADLSLDVDSLLLPQVKLSNVKLRLQIKDGTMTLEPLQADMAKGKLQGRLELSDRKGGLALKTKTTLKELALGDLLAQMQKGDMAKGSMDLEVDVSSQGRTVAEVMARMNGKTGIVVSNGQLNNKYMDLIGGDLGQTLNRVLSPVKKARDYTKLNCFVSMFDIKDGLAKVGVLLLDTEAMNVVGRGEVNLATEELDIGLDPSPKEGLDTKIAGKIGFSLGELAKPFKLGGTLARPKAALDTKAALTTLGKAVGGTALFGPAGLAGSLLAGESGEENPCAEAMAIARDARKGESKQEPAQAAPSAPEQAAEEMKKQAEDLQKKIKGLFN